MEKTVREKMIRWCVARPGSERVAGVRCSDLLSELMSGVGECPACETWASDMDLNVHECELCFKLWPRIRAQRQHRKPKWRR